jgi:hypothetical protein
MMATKKLRNRTQAVPTVTNVPTDKAGQRRPAPLPQQTVIVQGRGYKQRVPTIDNSEYGLERMAQHDKGQELIIQEHSRKKLKK